MEIKSIAILGAGSMGAQIAAECANAGFLCVLYDLKHTKADPNKRVKIALDNLLKANPKVLTSNSNINLIKPANFEDDLNLLKNMDLIIEAVSENLDIKKNLYKKIKPYLKENPNTILASNTSGLSLESLVKSVPQNLKSRFLGLHFFNPPRYLSLVELIATSYTDKKLINLCERFLVLSLGKHVVKTKDTPNFIANRLGIGYWALALHYADNYDIPINIVDKLTGKLIGRPKSATFRTADLVGLDIMQEVINTSRKIGSSEPLYKILQLPEWVKDLINNGNLGAKTKLKKGFYFKDKTGLKIWDKSLKKYILIDKEKNKLDPELIKILKQNNWQQRLIKLRKLDNPQAMFLLDLLQHSFLYTKKIAIDIADCAEQVDAVMCHGYGWDHGPFEIMQAAKFDKTKFYKANKTYYFKSKKYKLLRDDKIYKDFNSVKLPLPINKTKNTNKTKNPNKTKNLDYRIYKYKNNLVVSFNTKMATLTPEALDGLNLALDQAIKEQKALIIYQDQVAHFSAGADLTSLAEAFLLEGAEAADPILQNFQNTFLRLKYSSVPVVAAVQGYAFGGGCELLLHCDRVVSAKNSFIGLVEVGVGLIPAAGGCTEMARRVSNSSDPAKKLLEVFENIALAKVSNSNINAKSKGYLEDKDLLIMQPDLLLKQASDMADFLWQGGAYLPESPQKIQVMGKDLKALISMQIVNLQRGGRISEYDAYLANKLADVICCANDLSLGASDLNKVYVDNSVFLKAEREVFLELASNRKTQDRIEHLLQTGRPLRN